MVPDETKRTNAIKRISCRREYRLEEVEVPET